MLSRRITTADSFVVKVLLAMGGAASPALAETHSFLFDFDPLSSSDDLRTTAVRVWVAALMVMGVETSSALAETHPVLSSFGSFSNPNGIAVEESTGGVYVADIGTDTVYKFDANGVPVNFPSLGTNALTGIATPAKSFSFPNLLDTPAAIAVDNSTDPSDPSRGDLYVMDAGHDVIDKFNAEGKYIGQITGPFSGELLGLGVDEHGSIRVYAKPPSQPPFSVDVFDEAEANGFVTTIKSAYHWGGAAGAPEHGFAVSPAGDTYDLFFCGCVEKFGGNMEPLGRVDSGSPSDVAVAVDPVTGHVYVNDQSSVEEWDTGRMNGITEPKNSLGETNITSSGALVSSFGSSSLLGSPTGQGGIAVDGASGDVYVSSPAEGKVYVFGTSVPAVSTGKATGVGQEGATLQGVVNPHGAPVTACKFEYGASPGSDVEARGTLHTPVTKFDHEVSCAQSVGAGASPVSVSAQIGGLTAGRLYQFRLVAENASGTSESGGLLSTVAPAFGIKSFEVSFLNEDGTPDTQAGSHPYLMVTNIAFDTKVVRNEPEADSQYVTAPAGSVRDIVVDLPPGFVGDPNATVTKCTLRELEPTATLGPGHCPSQAQIGELEVEFGGLYPTLGGTLKEPVFNMVTPKGVALQIGANFIVPDTFIDAGVKTGGDYPVRAANFGVPGVAPVMTTRLTTYGVINNCVNIQGKGKYTDSACQTAAPGSDGSYERVGQGKSFLTLPTGCTGPLRSTVYADSYQEPRQSVEEYAHKEDVTSNISGEPVNLTGCSKLQFPPQITVKPDTTNASASSGLTVNVNVSQKAALNPDGLVESALRDTTVTLPQGVAINPSGANGLEACSEGLAGFEIGRGVNGSGFEEFNKAFEPGVKTPLFSPTALEDLRPGVSLCPDGSKIGTVDIASPLLPKGQDLKGSVYLAAQNGNPFGSLIAMYMFVEDPISGTTIKLTGEVSLTATGQIVTTFKNTPDLPFENLEIHFFGGERAPLTTPSRCGTYTTQASFTPWDGNAPVNTSSSFQIEHGPDGGPCPGASLPFNPSLAGGATNIQAGAFSPFTLTMSRKDGEQNLQSVEAHLPPGLSGILSNIELCPEPQANEGKCGPNSLIGETTVSVGVGGDPFTVSGGKFYLTGPYNGSGGCTVGQPRCAPFGITFEVPAKAGPFDLRRNSANPAGENACDCEIVRGKIEINPQTAALTITSDPPGSPYAIPTSIEGIPLEIQHINATTTRGNFQFNPTNCDKMEVTGTIHSSEGSLDTIGVPFQVTNCAALKFEPKFSVSTSGKTSKANGASLTTKVTYPNVPQGTDADIAKVKVELPKQLPSRLTTLQKACTAKQFEINPAGCPPASKIGYAVVHTPILPVPLEGPAIFVSHGGEAFPSLTMVLQGDNVTIDLVGTTFISKAGITSTTFKTVPDQPFSTFELTLPEGKFSALTANGNLCSPTRTVLVKRKVTVRVKGHRKTVTRKVRETQPAPLVMPTEFVAQNGAVIHQSTKIAVTGCPKKKATKASSTHHEKGQAKKKK
jgi:hypothetical protein